MNRLDLESLNGSVIKQLDQSPLKYKLIDADGKDYTGLPAEVVLINRGEEALRKTVEVKNNEFELTIDKVLPQASYTLEVVVDDKYIFPSDYSTKIWVNVSTAGQVIERLEKIGYDEILEKLKEDLTPAEVVAYDDSDLRRLIKEHNHDDRYAKIDHEHEEIMDALNQLEKEVIVSQRIIPLQSYTSLGLTDFEFSKHLKIIGQRAFELNELTSLNLPEGLEIIGPFAFSENKLKGELRLPKTLKRLGVGAFEKKQLERVYIPENTELEEENVPIPTFDPDVEIIRY